LEEREARGGDENATIVGAVLREREGGDAAMWTLTRRLPCCSVERGWELTTSQQEEKAEEGSNRRTRLTFWTNEEVDELHCIFGDTNAVNVVPFFAPEWEDRKYQPRLFRDAEKKR
jgi:hypothetical protein